MSQYAFRVHGWQAIAAVVLLFGYWGVSAYSHVRTVDDDMRDAIRQYLLNEYSGRSLKDVQRILKEAKSGQLIEDLPEVQQRDVQFSSASAVGRYGAPFEVIRVQITVDGGQPPEGAAVRYFRVEHVTTDKWLVVGQSDSYSYYSEFFPF